MHYIWVFFKHSSYGYFWVTRVVNGTVGANVLTVLKLDCRLVAIFIYICRLKL